MFLLLLCQYFILPTFGHPVAAVMSLIRYHINSWGETKSTHSVFILLFHSIWDVHIKIVHEWKYIENIADLE